MHQHADTFLKLEELGLKDLAYQPTYDFEGPFISPYHQFLANCPRKNGRLIQVRPALDLRRVLRSRIRDWLVDLRNLYRYGAAVPGWLLREEALKLYELAYYSQGDILELGTYHGLSSSIMARACRDSGGSKTLYTVDLDPGCILAAQRNLRKMALAQGVVTLVDDGASALRRFAASGLHFSLIFIDHSHTYQHVMEVIRELLPAAAPGALILFHDFNNKANQDSQNTKYGVYQAVCEGLDPKRFEFYGVYGGAALYRVR